MQVKTKAFQGRRKWINNNHEPMSAFESHQHAGDVTDEPSRQSVEAEAGGEGEASLYLHSTDTNAPWLV